jgi:Na+-transporting NADH:ubiquinone oxidoreductase subunit NqrD
MFEKINVRVWKIFEFKTMEVFIHKSSPKSVRAIYRLRDICTLVIILNLIIYQCFFEEKSLSTISK